MPVQLTTLLLSFSNIAWWAMVTVRLDVSSRSVLSIGIPAAPRASISPFGHGPATLLRIGRLEWKYAQKNAKKNITSYK